MATDNATMRRVYGNIVAAASRAVPIGEPENFAQQNCAVAAKPLSSQRDSASHPTTGHRMRGPRLDRIDRQILQLLQSGGQMTNIELAGGAGISPPPCLRRVRALEEAGLI